MAISRKDLLKELLPGLNKLFGVAYQESAVDKVLACEAKKKKELEYESTSYNESC
jgi:hypothetical protein